MARWRINVVFHFDGRFLSRISRAISVLPCSVSVYAVGQVVNNKKLRTGSFCGSRLTCGLGQRADERETDEQINYQANTDHEMVSATGVPRENFWHRILQGSAKAEQSGWFWDRFVAREEKPYQYRTFRCSVRAGPAHQAE